MGYKPRWEEISNDKAGGCPPTNQHRPELDRGAEAESTG
jgi:hypothetical protein